MSRYKMQPVPYGYFVAPVSLSDGSTSYACGQILYGDDEGDGEIVTLVPIMANHSNDLTRRVKLFSTRGQAVRVCEALKESRSTIQPIEPNKFNRIGATE